MAPPRNLRFPFRRRYRDVGEETDASKGLMQSMRRTFAILAIASIASAHAASRHVMTFDGVGAVRLGMSVAEIAQALGSPLDPVDKLVFSDECFVTERADKSDPGIQYTITNG